MKKIWILALVAIFNSNALAEDKKAAKAEKSETPYSKMIKALELTDEQTPKFRSLQKEHGKFLAKLKKIESAEKDKKTGELQQFQRVVLNTKTSYYKARTEKLKELLTRDQLKIWWKYQAGQKAKREKKSQEKK